MAIESLAGVLASAFGLVFVAFAVFAPIVVSGKRFVAHSAQQCISGIQTNLSTPGHVSIVSRGEALNYLPALIFFLLPALAAIRHQQTDHHRWLVLPWAVAGLTGIGATAGGCNSLVLNPLAAVTFVSASAGTTAAVLSRGRKDMRPAETSRRYVVLTLVLLVLLWPLGAAMVLLSRSWTVHQKIVGVASSAFAVVIYPIGFIATVGPLGQALHASEGWKVAMTFAGGVPLWAILIWSVVYLAKGRQRSGTSEVHPDL
ncbi:MAG: hypothetical protein QOK05_1462 [Chloroflexota bacterium]|jgi:hypothetical protein|nr:hypothetical protein [Chloroflexota bacterium]